MTLLSNFTIDSDLEEIYKERGVHLPQYNILEDPEAIKIVETDHVNENIIPVKEFKIVINKEAVARHYNEWNYVFVELYVNSQSHSVDHCKNLMEGYLLSNIASKFRTTLLKETYEKIKTYDSVINNPEK